jgi:hypothetical protein
MPSDNEGTSPELNVREQLDNDPSPIMCQTSSQIPSGTIMLGMRSMSVPS